MIFCAYLSVWMRTQEQNSVRQDLSSQSVPSSQIPPPRDGTTLRWAYCYSAKSCCHAPVRTHIHKTFRSTMRLPMDMLPRMIWAVLISTTDMHVKKYFSFIGIYKHLRRSVHCSPCCSYMPVNSFLSSDVYSILAPLLCVRAWRRWFLRLFVLIALWDFPHTLHSMSFMHAHTRAWVGWPVVNATASSGASSISYECALS